MPSLDTVCNALAAWGNRTGVPLVRLPDACGDTIVLRRDDVVSAIAELTAATEWQVTHERRLPDRTRLTLADRATGQTAHTLDLVHALSLYGLPYLTIDAVLVRAARDDAGPLRPNAPDAGLVLLCEHLHDLAPWHADDTQRWHAARQAGGPAFAAVLRLLFGQNGERRIDALPADRTGMTARALRRRFVWAHVKRHGVLALVMIIHYFLLTGWRHLDQSLETGLFDLTTRDMSREKR